VYYLLDQFKDKEEFWIGLHSKTPDLLINQSFKGLPRKKVNWQWTDYTRVSFNLLDSSELEKNKTCVTISKDRKWKAVICDDKVKK